MVEELKEVSNNSHFGTAWIIFIITILLSLFSFVFLPLWLSTLLFIIIYLPILIFILIHKWIKKGFASTLFTFSVWLNIIILLVPILGGLVALDVSNFAKDFSNSPKYVILQDTDNNFVFGTYFQSEQSITQGQLPVLRQNQLNDIKTEINQKSIKDKTVFLVKKELFKNIDTIPIKDLGITVTKEDIFQILSSLDTLSIIEAKLPKEATQGIPEEVLKQQLLNKFGSVDQIKSSAFILLAVTTLEKEGPKYLIDELKNGDIKIYPERVSINLIIKLLPADLVSGFLPQIPNLSQQSNTNQQNQEPKDINSFIQQKP